MKKLVSTLHLDHKEWLKYRKRGIGGSDAGAVCGLNPYRTAMQVYYDKISDDIEEKDETGIASTIVKESMLVRWGIGEQDMWEAASSNLKKEAYQFMNLRSLIGKSAKAADIKECRSASMCVLTNRVMYYGAAGILRTDLLEKLAQLKETDLYILPSSVHEVILLPALDWWDVDELRQMVKSVNAGWVDKMDWLSDEVYYYRRGSGQIEIKE